MELFYSSGLRLANSWAWTVWLAIDLADRTVRVVGKGSKTRIVPIGRFAIAALQAGCSERASI